MRISTRGEYGLRALMELGQEPNRALSLRDIAKRQNISLDYLEQIVPALKTAGLITAKRGAQGGYQLARAPHEISIFDALVALEGPIYPMMCVAPEVEVQGQASEAVVQSGSVPTPREAPKGNCMASGSCAVQEVWREMAEAIEAVLKRLTLGELVERQNRQFGVPIRTYSESEIMRLVVLN